jgi:D-alanyl-D-alanine carboxypeptidase
MKLIYQTAASVVMTAIIIVSVASVKAVSPIDLNTTTSVLDQTKNLIPRRDISDDLAKEFQEILDKNRQEAGEPGKGGVPGAVLAVISKDKGTWFGASGVADIQTGMPITPDAQFRIGSSTKTFTATVVLQLKDEGKLSLEDKIDKWLPGEMVDKITNGRNITVRQLLNHTSGIYDYADSGNEAFYTAVNQNQSREWKPEELVAYAYGKPSFSGKRCEEGAEKIQWCYSNTNYVLLGIIIEKATGSTLKSEIENRIIRPLRLNNTFFEFQTDEVFGGIVSCYWDINPKDGIDEDTTSLNMSLAWATGNMVSNAGDLAKFTKALFRSNLLKDDTLKEMLTPYEPLLSATQGEISYGLGVWYDKLSWGEAWRISGNGAGTTPVSWYFPERRLTFVSLANQDNGADYTLKVREAILKALLE